MTATARDASVAGTAAATGAMTVVTTGGLARAAGTGTDKATVTTADTAGAATDASARLHQPILRATRHGGFFFAGARGADRCLDCAA